MAVEEPVQERRLVGVVAQQLVAEPVDEEHDVGRGFRQLERRGRQAGIDAEGPGDRGQDVAERAPAVRGLYERHPAVRAESASAKPSRPATASGPSAAALTRSEKSSAVSSPV